ncbi:hypothetical protein M407DRAFT_32346 [Tulasnella calospora MUT 4182]|uniref:Uncharacterized protein n=1 Tax=Tulasnella calospora MUT 4182 TaxID=1051891 RepID=A0A0C3Q4W9_9AGAM|nr:hypothetical protein M407DRAFT_32346 [Tulasnella calospora MUT 4182]
MSSTEVLIKTVKADLFREACGSAVSTVPFFLTPSDTIPYAVHWNVHDSPIFPRLTQEQFYIDPYLLYWDLTHIGPTVAGLPRHPFHLRNFEIRRRDRSIASAVSRFSNCIEKSVCFKDFDVTEEL